MSDATPEDGRLATVARGPSVEIDVDGRPVRAYLGETIAGVFLAEGVGPFRTTDVRKQPRGYYCGMGICFECLVRVDGERNVRACMTPVREGMKIERERPTEGTD